MARSAVSGRRVLVVEDEYMIADELAQELGDAGAVVVGPVPSVDKVMALLSGGDVPDCAVLDVNLGGESVFPLADALTARGVPFVFTTGYDPSALPPRYASTPTCEKPIEFGHIASALDRLIAR